MQSVGTLQKLNALLALQDPIRIVDIGANPVDGPAPYAPLLEAGLCTVVGFEPQLEELARLEHRKSALETYLPYAVGRGAAQTLYLCQHSGWTSTLRPDERSIELFPFFMQNANVIGEMEIETRRLDDIMEVGHIDYLKIDIQGGERDVFLHGTQKLSDVLIVHTEVSFFPLYPDQPSFGEVDIILRSFGLLPHCFIGVKTGMIAPLVINDNPWHSLNQLLDGDVVYVRDLRDMDQRSDTELKKIALTAHSCYGSYDLAARCVARLVDRGVIAGSALEDYVSLLRNSAPLS